MQVDFEFAVHDVVVNRFGEVGVVKGLFLNLSDHTIGVSYKGTGTTRWEDEGDLRPATAEEATNMAGKESE